MGNSQQRVRKLRKAIDGNDQKALEKLVEKGVDINMAIDDIGNTPLTLAIQLNQCDTVRYLLQAKCDVERRCRQQFSALEIVLLNLAHTQDTAYLEILSVLLQAGAESVSEAVMETVFPMLHHNRHLVLKLAEIVARCSQPHHDIVGTLSHVIVQHNHTRCFWTLLEHGADLEDMWPNSCDKRFFLAANDSNMDDSGGPSNLFSTICCTLNPEFAQMCIQAANSRAVLSTVIYCILVYPIKSADVIADLLKTLAIAGYKMSMFLLTHLGKVHGDMAHWYREFQGRPKSLQHLSRLCIRNSLQTNVIYGVKQLPLPASLQDYLVLKDVIDSRPRACGACNNDAVDRCTSDRL